MKRSRIIAAYILSPFAGGIYWLVLNWQLNGRDPQMLRDPIGIISILGLFTVIGYVAEGLLGTPLLCWFRRRGYSSLTSFLWGGFAIGVIAWLYPLLVFFPILRERSLLYNLMSVLIGAVVPGASEYDCVLVHCGAADNKSLDASRTSGLVIDNLRLT